MNQGYLNQLLFPMNSDQLKELLNNDDKLDEQVDKVLESLKSQKVLLVEENRNRAEKNIVKKPRVIELRSKLAELNEEGRSSCAAIQNLLTQVKEKTGGGGKGSLFSTLKLLQTSATENEEQTEECLKRFNDNKINVDAFLEEFLSCRRTMHLRKLKAEKLQELISKPQTGKQQRHITGGGGGEAIPAHDNLPGAGSSLHPAHSLFADLNLFSF